MVTPNGTATPNYGSNPAVQLYTLLSNGTNVTAVVSGKGLAADASAAPMDGTSDPQRTVNGDDDIFPFITVVVLVAGVVGGLVLVITVILFCKYCIKRKKVLKRQPAFVTRQSPERSSFKPYREYESLDSTISTDGCSGLYHYSHGSPKHPPDGMQVGEQTDEESNIDLAVAKYKEHLQTEQPYDDVRESNVDFAVAKYKERLRDRHREGKAKMDVDQEMDTQPPRRSVEPGGGRRVSFQLDNTTPRPAFFRQGRRYTDGDFHHLKKLKIERLPASSKVMIKQRSLGAPPILHEALQSLHMPFLPPVRDPLPHICDEGDTAMNMYADANTPMLDAVCEESPSPTNKPSRTEVAVEVHSVPSNSTVEKKSGEKTLGIRAASPPKVLETFIKTSTSRARHSQSLEVVSPPGKWFTQDKRRVRSYEDELHEQDRRGITRFNKGPFYSADYDVMSEGGSPEIRSKVRYNDTGSFEEVNYEHLDLLQDIDVETMSHNESDDTETLNGAQKYRELWNLRATFEEEEDFSDTIRMEDMTSPEQSPERENASTSYTTSFESSTENPTYMEGCEQMSPSEHSPRRHSGVEGCAGGHQCGGNLLHPNYENRRQTYKSILSKRLGKEVPTSTDNSFDSVETVDTDGDISDTSRHEVTTTSFESTTDNTDSTSESQQHKLQQMRGDSGYKSLETQQPPKISKKQIHFALDDSLEQDEEGDRLKPSPSPEECHYSGYGEGSFEIPRRQSVKGSVRHFDRRNGKTASKKRRDFGRERQIIHVYESINEPETDSRSDQVSGDSFDDSQSSGKFSIFNRFFKTYQREKTKTSMGRDYSIDKHTDAIFHEFIRQDPHEDARNTLSVKRTGARAPSRQRLQRKYTEPQYDSERRRDKLIPEMRSASLGSDSSASSVRRLSPQDSIDEEYLRTESTKPWDGNRLDNQLSRPRPSIHEIPIIRLPEEETADA